MYMQHQHYPLVYYLESLLYRPVNRPVKYNSGRTLSATPLPTGWESICDI